MYLFKGVLFVSLICSGKEEAKRASEKMAKEPEQNDSKTTLSLRTSSEHELVPGHSKNASFHILFWLCYLVKELCPLR